MKLANDIGVEEAGDLRLEGWFAVEREMRALIDRRLHPFGLTCAQMMILKFIAKPIRLDREDDRAPTTVSEITEYFGLATRTVVVSVRQLQKSGFVLKRRSPLDSRVQHLTLSPDKDVALRNALLAYRGCFAMFNRIPSGQAQAMVNMLRSILKGVTAEARRDYKRLNSSRD